MRLFTSIWNFLLHLTDSIRFSINRRFCIYFLKEKNEPNKKYFLKNNFCFVWSYIVRSDQMSKIWNLRITKLNARSNFVLLPILTLLNRIFKLNAKEKLNICEILRYRKFEFIPFWFCLIFKSNDSNKWEHPEKARSVFSDFDNSISNKLSLSSCVKSALNFCFFFVAPN